MGGAPLSSVRNVGPAVAAALRRTGIATADDLRALGADGAYARLLRSGSRPHFIAYYSLVMGLQGRPWNDCRGDEKAALRARFDALVAARTGDGADVGREAFEAAMDAIGVVDR